MNASTNQSFRLRYRIDVYMHNLHQTYPHKCYGVMHNMQCALLTFVDDYLSWVFTGEHTRILLL